MSAARHALVKQLFHEALARPAAERAAFLQQACGDDAALVAEVREMLAVEDTAPDFLQPTQPLLGPAVAGPAAAPAQQFGPFRVLAQLGEGGMGAVYEAEQERPHRRVALKVLHPGMGTPQMLRRFELESEVLGRLEHPGIARIYEAGTEDTGRGPQPWFAMELIAGEPLTEHCARRSLPLAARLELLARVCDAVQHAHQRGIVHRDLKPANVLVDGSGQPKVLDFGIARAVGGELQAATLRTDPGMIVGTLQYMSPEQASADPDAVDVRTDVYSLGVLLYELAAGRPPLELGRLPMHEALRRVLVDEPAPLRTTARVPVDVAVIAHKALAKDKERRYAAAAELAADLRRFLRQEPIAAQPPSGWYRLRRFAARNKTLVAGMAATFAALVGGLSVALWQRNAAREALLRAEGINRFLLDDLLAAPAPQRLGRDAHVVDVLAPAEHSAERRFRGQPAVAAEVLTAVGASYRALGLMPDAERVLRRALALLGDGSTELGLRARGFLVAVLGELDRGKEAVELGDAVVADSTRLLGADAVETLSRRAELANSRWHSGQVAESIAELRQVTDDLERQLGAEDPRTLDARSELAIKLASSGQIGPAQELLARTLTQQERVFGGDHPSTLIARDRLAWIMTTGGAWQEAAALYATNLPALEQVYGPDHPYTAQARLGMAECALHDQRIDEAEQQLRRASADLQARLGAQHALTVNARLMLVDFESRRGNHDAAVSQAQQLVDQRRAAGLTDEVLGHALAKLGRCQQRAGDPGAAAAAFGAAVAVYRQVFTRPNAGLAQALLGQGVATRDAGDAAAAVPLLEEVLTIDRELWGDDHRNLMTDHYSLARTLLAAGRAADAAVHLRAALALAQRNEMPPDWALSYRTELGEALLQGDDATAGEQELLAALAGFAALGREDAPMAQRARRALVRFYEQQGRTQDAERLRR